LRDVAREAGVDEAILDRALDLRSLAKPHGLTPPGLDVQNDLRE